MNLAVMQPYLFAYIGYFQLINAVDTFIFYDDVNYIKGGWINRNKILLNGNDHFLTVPCIKASPNKQINEIEFDPERKEFKKLVKTISQAYKKAPYFKNVFPLIEGILKTPTTKISVLAQQSTIQVAHYLKLTTEFKISSIDFGETKGMEKAERLIEICKKTDSQNYINPIGGVELYEKDYFAKQGIQLYFIKSSTEIQYSQVNNKGFTPWLSIIDVLMFNSVKDIHKLLNKYKLL